jgi:hypothetical protein
LLQGQLFFRGGRKGGKSGAANDHPGHTPDSEGPLALPGDLARAIFGKNGPALPPPETPYEDEVERQAAKLRQELIERPTEAAKAASTLGQRVHAYASGDRAQRDGFDVGSVPEHVAVALLTMQPRQLLRLTAAGPEACGRWAEGGRTGLVGVPSCEKDWVSGNAPAGDGVPTPSGAPEAESLQLRGTPTARAA